MIKSSISVNGGIRLGKLTTGLIFVLFKVQLNANGHSIGILPAFAGYLAMVRGLRGWSVIFALAAQLASLSFVLRFIAAGRRYAAYRPPRYIPPRH